MNNSTYTTTDFSFIDSAKAGNSWKEERPPIEKALLAGKHIRLLTHDSNKPFYLAKFHRIKNLKFIEPLRELLNNPELHFTGLYKDDERNRGWYAVNKSDVRRLLDLIRAIYKEEEAYQTNLAEVEAQAALDAKEEADREEYNRLLSDSNRLKELSEKYGEVA